MADETLSQSEIDALLSGSPMDSGDSEPAAVAPASGMDVSESVAPAAASPAPEPIRETVSLGQLLQTSPSGPKVQPGGSEIHGVKFQQLGGGSQEEGVERNIGLLLDVGIQLTAELGNAELLVKDILELGRGSIIELDKIAGEPVDLKVNDKLVAKGEVVVINEKFGVRVTDIITPLSRIA